MNNHIAALAERFTAHGHRVTIIAPSDDRAAVKAARERVRAVLLGERDTLFAADEPYPRYFFAGGTFSVRHNRSVSYISPPVDLLSNVDVVLENEEFDVLHIHEPFVPSLGWTAMNHAESPIVATFHANSERFFWYWLGKPILSRVFPVFDAVVAVSPAARDTAARYFEGDYRVVPNGIDLERFRPPAERRPGPLRVLFVGGESRRKGLGVLLRALRYIGEDVPPFELEVCGSDEHEARFGHLVPERFRGLVRFRGRVPYQRAARGLRPGGRLLRAVLGQRVVRHRPARGDGHADGRARLRHRWVPRRRDRRRARASWCRRATRAPSRAPSRGCSPTRRCARRAPRAGSRPSGATAGTSSPARSCRSTAT